MSEKGEYVGADGWTYRYRKLNDGKYAKESKHGEVWFSDCTVDPADIAKDRAALDALIGQETTRRLGVPELVARYEMVTLPDGSTRIDLTGRWSIVEPTGLVLSPSVTVGMKL